MTSGIYQIRNLDNDKIYIGSSYYIRGRWNSHRSELRRNVHGNSYLQLSWNKYGEGSFLLEILEECDESILLEREQYYIDKLSSTNRDIGYNIALTAGAPMRGRKHTKETLKKVSESSRKWHENNKGSIEYDRYLENLSNSLIGHKLSTETKSKISNSLIGKMTGSENPFYGKKHSNESKQKVSISNSKLTMSEIKEVKILLARGEKPQNITEVFNTQHTNILSIKNHGKYDWVEIEDGFTVSNTTELKLRNLIEEKDLKLRGFTSINEVRKIKKLLFLENKKMSHIAKIFNTYDDKIRNIKNGKILLWVEDFEETDIKDELLITEVLTFNYYLRNGKLGLHDLNNLFKMDSEGMSNYKISRQLNVNENTVRHILKSENIKLIVNVLQNGDCYDKEIVYKYLVDKNWNHDKYIEDNK